MADHSENQNNLIVAMAIRPQMESELARRRLTFNILPIV
jgi:hypothetical protein